MAPRSDDSYDASGTPSPLRGTEPKGACARRRKEDAADDTTSATRPDDPRRASAASKHQTIPTATQFKACKAHAPAVLRRKDADGVTATRWKPAPGTKVDGRGTSSDARISSVGRPVL